MSSSPERPLKIQLTLPSSHPQLLEGLDLWLRLGLISDVQVRHLCQEFLTCTVVVQPQTQPEPEIAVATTKQATKSPIITPKPQKVAQPNFVTKMLQSLGEELSVRWLLFLGVFLVVLSSGVLAASQWERFPAAGQYGVLFAYTLTFWGFSFWTGKQNNLQLTTQTLLIVTLFLIPVNFWAMDSFGLWQNPLNLLTVAIAAPILTIITLLLCNNRTVLSHTRNRRLALINLLALSYLHWGWKLANLPLIAVYAAMIGTTIITITDYRQQLPAILNNRTEQPRHLSQSLFTTAIVYSLILLLSRAIFVAGVDVTQLGLAIGICGWLITWLVQQVKSDNSESVKSPYPSLPWEIVGSILLFLGWNVSVINYPGQALAVSGLALWYVVQRLQRYSLKFDLAAIFVIGVQSIWLAWRLVPTGMQQWTIATATYLTKAQNEPWALLSVALFPYLILMLVVGDRLRRAEKRELANFGEALALIFGAFLTTIATINPILRSLNLVLSTITLAVVTKRRSPSVKSLVYLTHSIGVLALFSVVDWLLPNLPDYLWASIVLVVMVVELLFSLGNGIWQQSAWHIGLGLSVVSFILFFVNLDLSWYARTSQPEHWGVIWLITPITLTVLASRTTAQRRTTRSFLSLLAVAMAQFLTLPLPGIRLIGLAVGAGVMYANTRYLRNQPTAGFTIGLGLSLLAALLWEGIPGLPHLSIAGWFVVGAIATFSLWLARTILQRRDNDLAFIYADASDKWAIALSSVELLLLTLHSMLVYQAAVAPGLWYLLAIAVTLAAIVYRTWREPTNSAFYGIAWCVELLIAEVLGFGERSLITVAIANIALGLFTQILGEWWQRRYHPQRLPSSLHILPLLYGAFSVLLRWQTFTEWTGLFTLGVALIFIGVGRRQTDFKPLLYLGIIGVSISAYELLFYQMSQAKGGAFGDGLIAMSTLGASIMLVYSRLAPWLSLYLRLSRSEITGIAHLHWAWSSLLLFAAIALPIHNNRLVGLGTGGLLILYAIFQGRRTADSEFTESPRVFGRITIDEMWVYLGLLEFVGMRVYWRETAVGQLIAGPLVPWNGAIACLIAYFLYSLPWENWGWSKKPWQLAAYIWPLVILWETRLYVYSITLLLAAGFYLILAKVSDNIRVSYISVVLVDWALFKWFYDLRLIDGLWYVGAIALSILYIAQVDTQLKLPESKTARHILRVVGSSLICGWAILFDQHIPFIPAIISLITIFAGLAFRIRAFLYVGTTTFLITSVYQLVIFSLRYSFLKWIIGLLVGIALIYIAANFETRRTQLNNLLRNTSNEFQEWE
ncbi:DUF2157 domain-containing protein [Nostoc sp. FACHB-110]|uniref:DUF2157 domain-containing protein n=1 Tax=Nostoc sp. FACHB-110 TaxID=2692834 RepID=UPI001689812C|nr:DUF2157 domain-containing protein [Nostoc sp. FACHB-110]MBD2438118.1 DUF2157 domain-containing protein [Nostoc sp. FACHB-110]